MSDNLYKAVQHRALCCTSKTGKNCHKVGKSTPRNDTVSFLDLFLPSETHFPNQNEAQNRKLRPRLTIGVHPNSAGLWGNRNPCLTRPGSALLNSRPLRRGKRPGEITGATVPSGGATQQKRVDRSEDVCAPPGRNSREGNNFMV